MKCVEEKSRFRCIATVVFGAALLIPLTSAAQDSADQGPFPVTGPLSGYMEFHVNKDEFEPAIVDFHRFVLLFNHSFSPRLRFIGELELEHAFVEGLEESGELELEQAYVDFLLSRPLNLRAGMVLMPIGIINERHEPPTFFSVERPFVDTFIIPTTWFDVGAGVHGELGRGFRYRAYVSTPLNALEFNADEGIRNGRQKGAQANVRNAAYAARAEYRPLQSLTVGASVWTGDSSFAVPRLDTSVVLGEFDAWYRRGRTELRGVFAQIHISDAGELNEALALATGVSPNIAETLRGFYGEAAYRIWNAGAPRDLVVFTRYENFDTQYRMPEGFVPLKEFDRDAWVTGVAYYPDPDIAVKADYVFLRNQSDLFPSRRQVNVGLGWWF